jgi:hypothetical protein
VTTLKTVKEPIEEESSQKDARKNKDGQRNKKMSKANWQVTRRRMIAPASVHIK